MMMLQFIFLFELNPIYRVEEKPKSGVTRVVLPETPAVPCSVVLLLSFTLCYNTFRFR